MSLKTLTPTSAAEPSSAVMVRRTACGLALTVWLMSPGAAFAQPDLREELRGLFAQAPAAAPAGPGYAAAGLAYQALAKKDYAVAVASAREAAALEPGNAMYRGLLVEALSAAGQLPEAERAASDALTLLPTAVNIRLQRGYIRQRLKRLQPAMDDFSTALGTPGLTAAQTRNVRLTLADLALAAKDPGRALSTLAPLAGERSYDIAARRGFALQALDRQSEALAAFTLARPLASNAADRAAMSRGAIAALIALDRKEEARAWFTASLQSNEFAVLKPLDVAYVASQVGDDATAHEYFARADRLGQLRGQALLDAGYVAKRRFDNAAAEAYFRRAIDAEANGEFSLDRQRLLEVRREVTNVSRTWGMYASIIYGPTGSPQTTAFSIPTAGGGSTVQTGAEIYWRPPVIGNRNGATVELFGRAFETLYDRSGGATGSRTIQGSAGVRWKPLAEHNFILEASRLFPIGELARHDWLLRVAYSRGEGGELRLDTTHWTYWQVYAELDRFTEVAQSLALAEARFGHSFRLPTEGDNIVVTPFLVAAANYDSSLGTSEAVGAGAGINVRFWFRQDKYSGPSSYIDLTAQYRLRLTGDTRAEGWFASASLSY